MARTMLNESKLRNIFLPQALHTTLHILNIGILINNAGKNPMNYG